MNPVAVQLINETEKHNRSKQVKAFQLQNQAQAVQSSRPNLLKGMMNRLGALNCLLAGVLAIAFLAIGCVRAALPSAAVSGKPSSVRALTPQALHRPSTTPLTPYTWRMAIGGETLEDPADLRPGQAGRSFSWIWVVAGGSLILFATVGWYMPRRRSHRP